MLLSIARIATRRPRRVALVSLVVFVVVAVFGGPAAGLLSVSNQFDDPSSGVAHQRALLEFPLLALISLLVFRGIAALLPVAVGGISVLGTFALLRVINIVHPLSNFALNLVIGVGLGLAVDYSLLLVWRFREELSRGASVADAVSTTLQTAGRAVAYSGVAVAGAMMVLTLFPQPFLISMGIGAEVVALVAAAASLLILPAPLTLLAARVVKVMRQPAGR